MGINPANWIDLGALLKSIFNWIYSKIFATEIAQRDKDEASTKTAVQRDLKLVKDADKQIKDVDGQKLQTEQQIQVEQKRQAVDEQKMAEITHDKDATDAAIAARSDHDVLRGDL